MLAPRPYGEALNEVWIQRTRAQPIATKPTGKTLVHNEDVGFADDEILLAEEAQDSHGTGVVAGPGLQRP